MATYSRINQKKQSKALKQSLLLTLGGVLILSLFFIGILPLSIRIYDTLSKKNTIVENQDVFPPQIPVLLPLPEATNSATLSIAGYGEALSLIKLYKNNIAVSDIEADDSGNFSFDSIFFSEGEHTIHVTSSDLAENESKSQQQTIIIDTEAPQLTVEQPQPDQTVTRRREQVIPVKGITDPNSQVFVNDKLLIVDSAGNFSGQFSLQEGENKLLFKAVDKAGNATEQELIVHFNP